MGHAAARRSTDTTQTPLPAMRCERASCGYWGAGRKCNWFRRRTRDYAFGRGATGLRWFRRSLISGPFPLSEALLRFRRGRRHHALVWRGVPCAGSVSAGLAVPFRSAKPFAGVAAGAEITLSPAGVAPCAGFVAAGLADAFCSVKPISSSLRKARSRSRFSGERLVPVSSPLDWRTFSARQSSPLVGVAQ